VATRVVFDRSLYAPEAVHAAVVAYSEFARFDVSETPDSLEAVVSEPRENDLDLIVHSFCNYALQETIARSRQVAQ